MNRKTLCFVAAALAAGALSGLHATVAAGARHEGAVCSSYRLNDQYPIRLCDKGDDVKSIQARLRSIAFTLDIDGYFGPATRRAVLEFQRRNGLDVDGLVGPATWSALSPFVSGSDTDGSGVTDPDESSYLPLSPPSTTCGQYRADATYPLSMCDKGPAVRVAQAFLTASDGHLEVDGYFGPLTDYAVRNYQSIVGLEIDGLLGPRTWSSLTHDFTCGSDSDRSGEIDPDEVILSPAHFPDVYSFLQSCNT